MNTPTRFFLGNHRSFPSFSSQRLQHLELPEGYLCLATIAFGASQSIVPKYYYRLGKEQSRPLHLRRLGGQRTEQVKTGQVNPDRPLVGPSVGTFVGCFMGSPRRAENKEIGPRGCSRGGSRGRTRGPTQALPGPGKSTPGQGPKSAERVRPGVSKEFEKSLQPDWHTHKGRREKVLKVMNFRIFSGSLKVFSGVFPYASK